VVSCRIGELKLGLPAVLEFGRTWRVPPASGTGASTGIIKGDVVLGGSSFSALGGASPDVSLAERGVPELPEVRCTFRV
jgi:hypothetical protein